MCLPALLLCLVFAGIASQEIRTLPFISTFLWAQVLYYDDCLCKYVTTSDLSRLIPEVAATPWKPDVEGVLYIYFAYLNYPFAELPVD